MVGYFTALCFNFEEKTGRCNLCVLDSGWEVFVNQIVSSLPFDIHMYQFNEEETIKRVCFPSDSFKGKVWEYNSRGNELFNIKFTFVKEAFIDFPEDAGDGE